MGKRARGGPWGGWIGVFALALFPHCVRAETVRVPSNSAGAKDGSKGKGALRCVAALAALGTVLLAGAQGARAAWSPLYKGVNDTVYALAVSGDEVYAGGLFTAVGGFGANRMAVWDGTGWSPLSSGMNNTVNALVASGGKVYAGGSFTTAGGVAANNVAVWDGTSWSPLGGGMNSAVRTLAVSGDEVYAGGSFTTAGGVAANYVAVWDGTSWSPLGGGMNGVVSALAASGGRVYAGGNFTTAGGGAVNYVAVWDGTSWSPLGGGMDSTVRTLSVLGGKVYAGGSFTTAGGGAANNVAVWDGTSWSPLGTGMNGLVHALAASGGKVYAGGSFTTAGGRCGELRGGVGRHQLEPPRRGHEQCRLCAFGLGGQGLRRGKLHHGGGRFSESRGGVGGAHTDPHPNADTDTHRHTDGGAYPHDRLHAHDRSRPHRGAPRPPQPPCPRRCPTRSLRGSPSLYPRWSGARPLASPTPIPGADLPPTGTPNPPSLGLTPDMLSALLGAGIDTTLYQVVLTGQQGGMVTYGTTPGGVVTPHPPVHRARGERVALPVGLSGVGSLDAKMVEALQRPTGDGAGAPSPLGETTVLRMADGGTLRPGREGRRASGGEDPHRAVGGTQTRHHHRPHGGGHAERFLRIRGRRRGLFRRLRPWAGAAVPGAPDDEATQGLDAKGCLLPSGAGVPSSPPGGEGQIEPEGLAEVPRVQAGEPSDPVQPVGQGVAVQVKPPGRLAGGFAPDQEGAGQLLPVPDPPARQGVPHQPGGRRFRGREPGGGP